VVIQPRPVIRGKGIVSTGDYSPALAPGSLASIFGQNLAFAADPAKLQVRAGGVEAPVLFASPGQVNIQIPFEAPANSKLRLINSNGSVEADVQLAPTAPSIIAVTTGNRIASAANAPQAGSVVVVYATGLGACAKAGEGGAAEALAHVDVWMGDMKIQPLFAGLAPGFAGLNQVNFIVPPGTARGAYALRVATPDGSSRAVSLMMG
jgi:adhesin/invasin